MTKQIKSRGFTIVELLIVIVIIAILATITIIAYNGITARAHASASLAAAQSVANKAEAYNAELGTYPMTVAAMTGAASTTSYFLPADSITRVSAAIASAPTNDNTIAVQACPVAGPAIGLKIYYWDYSASPAVAKYVSAGSTGGTCGPAYVAS